MITNVHATGLVLWGTGIVIQGPSGSGKSLLALQCLDRFPGEAQLVADDRLDLEVTAEGLIMRAPPAIAGLIELRGLGLVRRDHLPRARVDLVVDLVDHFERMPEPSAFQTSLLGVTVGRCPMPRRGLVDPDHQMLILRECVKSPGFLASLAENTT